MLSFKIKMNKSILSNQYFRRYFVRSSFNRTKLYLIQKHTQSFSVLWKPLPRIWCCYSKLQSITLRLDQISRKKRGSRVVTIKMMRLSFQSCRHCSVSFFRNFFLCKNMIWKQCRSPERRVKKITTIKFWCSIFSLAW